VDHGSHQVPGPADVKYQPANPLDKPVLDREAFQQLLSAAYTLQAQNHPLPAKDPAPATVRPNVEPLALSNVSSLQPDLESAKVSDLAPEIRPAASFKPPQPKPAKLRLPVRHPVPPVPSRSGHKTLRKRISPHDGLFWRAATVAAMAAVSALLLAAWIDHPSPLPPGLALPSEVLQQQVPFRRAEPIVTSQPQSSKAGTKTFVMEPPTTTKAGPAEPTVSHDRPGGTTTTGSAQRTTANPNRHSSYESEANLVAPDTGVRYSPRSAAPLARVQRKP
jgi:hypothetical protein